jgi:hypothetical protein
VFFDDSMMMLNDVQYVVASIFERSKTVIFEVFQGLIKYQARESRPKTSFLTFFDVSVATRHAWCVCIIKFVHAQQILLFQHSASVLLGPQKRPVFDPFLDPLKTPQK